MSAPTVESPRSVCLDTAGVAHKIRRTQQTVRLFVKEQGLPAARINGRLMFDEAEVDAWLDSRSVPGSSATPGDDHRAAIKKLVDAAPALTAEQAARIKAVLSGAA